MADQRERQTNDESVREAARTRAAEPGLARENAANTERQQTEDRRDTSTLDESGEVPTSAFPDRTNRADRRPGGE